MFFCLSWIGVSWTLEICNGKLSSRYDNPQMSLINYANKYDAIIVSDIF